LFAAAKGGPMPAPTTTDEFLNLVRKSGVVDEKRLGAYLARVRAAGSLPPEPAKFAGFLVRDGILTHFQAEQVLQGKWRRFTIGKYKVLERLGAGGMGSVYLCEHKLMRRRVAVKVLPTAKADDPSSLERFYREARAVAALDHPNIVRAYDIDQDDKLHFLVMEYVDGSSLQDIIKKAGPMDVTRAAHYMRQSAQGLQHAHESAGLVHRDIKPGNILVDRTGVVKILDMGLARFFHDEEDVLTKKYDENVLGTADYLAPEQALDSHGVDIRADIYSLGATFYYCLTGRTPFTDGTVAQKLIWHQTRQPKAIRQTRPEVPEALAALIERMMSKDPAQRPQTPLEVAEALIGFTQTPIDAPPDAEMPHLSPAALGLPGGEAGGSSVSNPPISSSQPSSGQRKSWQVPTSGSRPPSSAEPTRPTAGSPSSPTSPAPAAPKPARPNPPNPSARVATPQKVAVPQTKRAPAAAPQPSEEEEGEPWQQLDPDTEEIAASRANTPPRQSRRSSTASNRRLDGVRAYAALLDKRTRVIIVVAAVAVVLLGLMAAGVIWAYSYNNTPPAQPEKPPPARPALRVGKDQKYLTVWDAIRNALPGDHIIVQGPEHEEELVFDNQPRKDLTIESEGAPVHWRTPKMKDSPVLVVLRSVEGLKLRGFIFDGDGRAKTGILLGGRCPGTTLEDLTIQGFTGSGLLIQNCEGEKGRPVTIKSLKITTAADKQANAAVQFLTTVGSNRIIHFNELKLDGSFTTPILNRELASEDVTGLP
jgi:eukaryotic-like serine/threonine-protein kinase